MYTKQGTSKDDLTGSGDKSFIVGGFLRKWWVLAFGVVLKMRVSARGKHTGLEPDFGERQRTHRKRPRIGTPTS